jgi:caa(3)-type oxidase subunit IV
MNSAEKHSGGLTTYLVVYVCILVLAGVQIVLAYQHTEGAQLFFRMLSVALVQAWLAVMFFMHMRTERRSLVLSLGLYTVFVLLMMNMIWSDSFRLLHMRPFPK